MLKTAFLWLDAHPHAYWAIALAPTLLLAGWLVAALRRGPAAGPARRADWAAALFFLAVLLAWRWPMFLDPSPLNPDEAQLVAGALVLQQDPVPYRSLDMATCGPLEPFPLLPTHWLGVPQDYFNARLTAVLLVWGTLCAVYGLARAALPAALAVIALLPTLLFYATAADGSFTHFSSEHPPLFFGWAAAWLIWSRRPQQSDPGARLPAGWLLGGFCLGLLPWMKLQAAPLAAAFALWGAGLALADTRRPPAQRLRLIAWLAGAALLPAVGLFATMAASGQLEQFQSSFLGYNLRYMGAGQPPTEVLATLFRETMVTRQFPTFLLGTLLVLAAGLAPALRRRSRPDALGWGALLFLLAAAYATWAPHRGFPHYLLLLVPPLALAVALAGRAALARGRFAAFIAVVALVAAGQLVVRARNGVPPVFGRFAEHWRHPYSAVARQINALKRPGDTLATWGWWSHIHVETGLPQATRDGHSERQLVDTPLRDTFFRPRYMADIERSRPAFFVDAVGPGSFAYESRVVNGHETFPALRDFIRDNYVLVEDHGTARLYMRAALADSRHFGVPVVVPITLAGMTHKSATGEVSLFDGAKEILRKDGPHVGAAPKDPGAFDGECLMAHAPSVLAHAVPPRAATIVGGFGILPGAYADPAQGTDGATFFIDVILADGRRTQLLERFLDPVALDADRPPVNFALPLPADARSVEFRVETGPTASFDWTFWRNLRFELPWEDRPVAKP